MNKLHKNCCRLLIPFLGIRTFYVSTLLCPYIFFFSLVDFIKYINNSTLLFTKTTLLLNKFTHRHCERATQPYSRWEGEVGLSTAANSLHGNKNRFRDKDQRINRLKNEFDISDTIAGSGHERMFISVLAFTHHRCIKQIRVSMNSTWRQLLQYLSIIILLLSLLLLLFILSINCKEK